MKHLLLIPLVFFAVLFTFSCNKPLKKDPQAKPTIIATVGPYAYFAENLLQDIALVDTLVPSNANLHLYEPPPKQIEKIQKALVWIRLGEAFEQKAVNFLLEQKTKPIIIDLSEHTNLLFACCCEHHHHHDHLSADLHYWLSPQEAKRHVFVLQDLFCSLFPEKKEIISERALELSQKFDTLDATIASLLANKKNNTVLVAHAALGYFCRDYHLHQVAIEHEGKDPLPRDLMKVFQTVQKENPSFILTQVQHNKKPAEWVSDKLNVPLKEIDPYAKNYFDNMLRIASAIGQ